MRVANFQLFIYQSLPCIEPNGIDRHVRFPLLLPIPLPDLVGVDEVLPDDVGCGGYRRDRIEELLGKPDGKHSILLTERLSAGNSIAVATAEKTPHTELYQADDTRPRAQFQLHPAVGLGKSYDA